MMVSLAFAGAANPLTRRKYVWDLLAEAEFRLRLPIVRARRLIPPAILREEDKFSFVHSVDDHFPKLKVDFPSACALHFRDEGMDTSRGETLNFCGILNSG